MSQAPTKLWNRNFLLLWQGQFVSHLGSQACSIAMMFWIKHALGSASLMGGLMMVLLLPTSLLGPLGGVVADLFSRRRIIILADLLSGTAVLLMAALMWLRPDHTLLILIVVLAGAMAMGILQAAFAPAIGAAIPDLVPADKLRAANSVYQSSSQIAQLVGQSFGGLLFVLLGAPLLFLINGLSYWFSALSETFIAIPQKLPAERQWRRRLAEIRKDLLAGLRFGWSRPGLRVAVGVATVLNFFVAPVLVLLPFFVENVLGESPAWYGYLLATFGIGALIGFSAAGMWKIDGRLKVAMMIAAAIGKAVAIAGAGVVAAGWTALGLMWIIGILTGFFNIHLVTIVQMTTPSEIRGRVFGVLNALTVGLMPVGMGLGGIVADLLDQNIRLIYFTCGTIMAVLSVAAALSGSYRRFLATGTGSGQENEHHQPELG